MMNNNSYDDFNNDDNFFLYLSNFVKNPYEDFYDHKFMIDNYSEFSDYTQEEMFTKIMNGAYAHSYEHNTIYCYDNNYTEKIGTAGIILGNRVPKILEIDADFNKTMCYGFAYYDKNGNMKLDLIDLVKNKGFDGVHISYSYCTQYYYNLEYAHNPMSFPVSYGADKYLFYNMDWVFTIKLIDLFDDNNVIVKIPTYEWDNMNAFYEYLDIETEDRYPHDSFSFFNEHKK